MSFNLPFGVFVAGADPIDADRYVVADIPARDLLVTNGRAGNGQQVWVLSEKKLYVLKDVSIPTWAEVGGGGGTPETGQIVKEIEFDYDFSEALTMFIADQALPFPGAREIVFAGNFYRVTVEYSENIGNAGGRGEGQITFNASAQAKVLAYESVLDPFNPARDNMVINFVGAIEPVVAAGSNSYLVKLSNHNIVLAGVRIKITFFE